MFRKLLDRERLEIILGFVKGAERTDVERGQVLCKPASITPHTKFEAQAYVLKKKREEDIHLSLLNTDLSFILEQLTLQVKSSCLQVQKW